MQPEALLSSGRRTYSRSGCIIHAESCASNTSSRSSLSLSLSSRAEIEGLVQFLHARARAPGDNAESAGLLRDAARRARLIIFSPRNYPRARASRSRLCLYCSCTGFAVEMRLMCRVFRVERPCLGGWSFRGYGDLLAWGWDVCLLSGDRVDLCKEN